MSAPTAILYARFSPRKRADRCESCDVQLEYARQYCKLRGWTILAEYRDDAYSGGDQERPGFKAAIARVCADKAVLIVYSLSRFARSLEHTVATMRKIEKAGAQVVSLHENFDTTSPTGRFIFHVFAALDQLERERISERTSEAMAHYQSNGRLMSRHTPYGYAEGQRKRIVESDGRITWQRTLAPYAPEQEIIAMIVKWFRDENMAPMAIRRRLNDEGIPPRRAAKWEVHIVRRILRRRGLLP